jgi:beta-lactamase regulating signal transducer with metallopeptidase domain/effector-binding domain-containing protein
MIPSHPQFLANHLWQSTLFAAVLGLMTLALRRNRAQTRYWLWLAASLKFLLPFSLLVNLGSHLGHAAPAITPPAVSYVMEQVGRPFSVPTPLGTTSAGLPNSLLEWVAAVLYAIWAIGFAMLLVAWGRGWRSVRAAMRGASPVDLQIGVHALISPAFWEPGVFGVRRPVLLLPAGITDLLTPAQLKAIVAHELCHIRRRDNLTAALHMIVEAVFWFHPLVWWLGARLMEERERACDEEVLLMGSEPKAYAEGILRICELRLGPPLPCVSGASRANLCSRIELIMSNRVGATLSCAQRAALVLAAAAALGIPVGAGMTVVGNAGGQDTRSWSPKPQGFEPASTSSKLEKTTMRYQIEVKQSVPTYTAVIRGRVRQQDLSKFVPAACGEVWSFVRSAGLPKPGRHVALYLNDGQGSVEVGAEVGEQFAGNDRIQSSRLPEGRVATTAHFGSYAHLGDAHAAIREWSAQHGQRLSNVSWEIYGHWEESWNADPSKIRTDVFYLLDDQQEL